MRFADKIRELRESHQITQYHVSTTLTVDNVMYCGIEYGTCQSKRKHISIIAEILQPTPEELLARWLADHVPDFKDKTVSAELLDIAIESIKK
jgi:transcriptional regulator with XRE-family HTH domain